MDDPTTILEFHRLQWEQKPVLNKIYSLWYSKIFSEIKTGGMILELGAGSGMGKNFNKKVILGDIVYNKWLDLVLDGEKIPVKDRSLSNIIMIDTLHHLKNPIAFLKEATRVLRDNGKIIAIEPYTGKAAYYFWRYLHHEPVDLNYDIFTCSPRLKEAPFDSNQAIPYLMLKNFLKIKSIFPEFKLLNVHYFDFLYYALSGGFSKPNLIPPLLEKTITAFDDFLLRIFGQFISLRMMLIIEKIEKECNAPMISFQNIET